MKRKLIIYTFAAFLLLSGCAQQNANNNMISAGEAQEIALTHAGLVAEQVTFTKASLDMDYRNNYDVEFYTQDQKEYNYEIDCYTGKILEWDVESIHEDAF